MSNFMHFPARFGLAALPLAAVAGMASVASAAPQIEYYISGSFQAEPAETSELQFTSFTVRAGGASNGSMDIAPAGEFGFSRIEIFSDPDITPFPTLYANVDSFSYFGLLVNTEAPGDSRFFIAARTGTLSGMLFEDVFADYLATHPTITNQADFVAMIETGPDFPTPGANQDWIDFNSFVIDDQGDFSGLIQTTFQSGVTLDLHVFSNDDGSSSVFGEIQVEAIQIPEPAGLAMLLLPTLLAARRRRVA